MIASLVIAIALAALNPEPVLIRSAIDLSRIIGLPRMKAFDKHILKTVYLNEMDSSQTYQSNTRREFFNNYFRISTARIR